MTVVKASLDSSAFNQDAVLPFELRLKDFEPAMQDVYDFFYDVNRELVRRGLSRLDDLLRPAIMSGFFRTFSQPAWPATPGVSPRIGTTTAIRTY
jgi:hypothetical protein